jgi:phosphoribosylanthranilate isomerase
MSTNVKICGLKDAAAVDAAIAGGAKYLGFVFYNKSPRAIAPSEAYALSHNVPPHIILVGLFVDPSDAEIKGALAHVALGILQLHGSESPERVAEIKALTNLPVMKALPIATASDLDVVNLYEPVADWLLFDAKPPVGSERPGGNAQTFDWTLLQGLETKRPWMLAGGLNVDNLADAVRITGTRNVDVSSGVESAPGQKDPAKISDLLALAAKLTA